MAWTDAALAMVELARSRAVRRLSRDDGEWRCAIGSQWPVPEWLDDVVEFSHPVLPLAILGALIEALPKLELIALFGVGTDTAAALVVCAGDNPERLHSEPAWAHLCGVAPIPAGSGQTSGRVRLDRGGDRQANAALWRIVMVRIAHHPETTAYYQRKLAEGLSKSDIIRLLKRYVAREVYRHLLRA